MCGKDKLLCCSSMMGLCRIFRKLLNSGKLLSSLQLIEVTEEIVSENFKKYDNLPKDWS